MEEKNNGSPTDFELLMGKEYFGFKGKAAIDKLLAEKQGKVKWLLLRLNY